MKRVTVFTAMLCCYSAEILKDAELRPRLRVALPEGRVVGGQAAAPHAHPYQVSLQINFLWLRAHTCGGSILNSYWVLTAAHCISESFLVSLLPIDAIAGVHDVINLGYSAQISRVDKRIPHPQYKGGVGPNDIALLKVKTPFTFSKAVQPIQLPARDFIPTTRSLLTLTGWGLLRTSFFPDMPINLQEVQVPFVPFKECYEAIDKLKDSPSELNPLSIESNVCTGPLTGGVAACNGDSGGPLVQLPPAPEETPQVPEDSNPVDDNEDTVVVGSENTEATVNVTGKANEGRSKVHIRIKTKPCMVAPVKKKAPGAVLVGVVSWGMTPCGSDGAPTVYTNVANFIDFIDSHIH